MTSDVLVVDFADESRPSAQVPERFAKRSPERVLKVKDMNSAEERREERIRAVKAKARRTIDAFETVVMRREILEADAAARVAARAAEKQSSAEKTRGSHLAELRRHAKECEARRSDVRTFQHRLEEEAAEAAADIAARLDVAERRKEARLGAIRAKAASRVARATNMRKEALQANEDICKHLASEIKERMNAAEQRASEALATRRGKAKSEVEKSLAIAAAQREREVADPQRRLAKHSAEMKAVEERRSRILDGRVETAKRMATPHHAVVA